MRHITAFVRGTEDISQGPQTRRTNEDLEQKRTETSYIYWAQLNRFNLKIEKECSLRNVVF
jgi:hypothetical protein